MFFCKQKTAYEMRISDWSSDVCSSDLQPGQLMIMGREQATAAVDLMHRLHHRPCQCQPVIGRRAAPDFIQDDEAALGRLRQYGGGLDQIGRASCRERVCQSV